MHVSRLLIVVDYQVDFVDGALGFAGAEKLAQPIANKNFGVPETGGTTLYLRSIRTDPTT